MNQVSDMLNLAEQAITQNIDAVLATVVHTEGSAYRRAGAMMLICADGRYVGMISGGCLEPHIIKRAFWLTRQGANVQVYQTGEDVNNNDARDEKLVNEDALNDSNSMLDMDDDDLELNFGLGCNGRVHVLFERLDSAYPMLQTIKQVRQTQQPKKIATLVRVGQVSSTLQRSSLGATLEIGTRIDIEASLATSELVNVNKDSIFSDTLFPIIEQLSQSLSSQLNKKDADYIAIENEHNQIESQSSYRTEWLVQHIKPQLRLLICGAGGDVAPLITMAKMQDWHVTVIDSRPQYATRLRFPNADHVLHVALEDEQTLLKLSDNAAVAVMSHSLTQDRARLKVLLQHPPPYLGQLGPVYRTERLIKEIFESVDDTVLVDMAAGISRLNYPIGIKLGGDGPEALALSIIAQVSAVMHDSVCKNNDKEDLKSRPKDSLTETSHA